MLTHLFTTETCAQCRLCCHFCRESAWETPFLEEAMSRQLQERGVSLCSRPNGSRSFALSFLTDSSEETVNCPLLNPASGCSLPREDRPFECRVWPLRLMRTPEESLCIGCYNSCPALADANVAQGLADYAVGELLPTLLDYARRFPQSVRAFNPAYTVIWREDADFTEC